MNHRTTTTPADAPDLFVSPMQKRLTRNRKVGARSMLDKKKSSGSRRILRKAPGDSAEASRRHPTDQSTSSPASQQRIPRPPAPKQSLSPQPKSSNKKYHYTTRRTEGRRSGSEIRWIIHIDSPGGHAAKLILVRGLETDQVDDDEDPEVFREQPTPAVAALDPIQNYVAMQLASASNANTADSIVTPSDITLDTMIDATKNTAAAAEVERNREATNTIGKKNNNRFDRAARTDQGRTLPGRLDSGLETISQLTMDLQSGASSANDGDDTIEGSAIMTIADGTNNTNRFTYKADSDNGSEEEDILPPSDAYQQERDRHSRVVDDDENMSFVPDAYTPRNYSDDNGNDHSSSSRSSSFSDGSKDDEVNYAKAYMRNSHLTQHDIMNHADDDASIDPMTGFVARAEQQQAIDDLLSGSGILTETTQSLGPHSSFGAFGGDASIEELGDRGNVRNERENAVGKNLSPSKDGQKSLSALPETSPLSEELLANGSRGSLVASPRKKRGGGSRAVALAHNRHHGSNMSGDGDGVAFKGTLPLRTPTKVSLGLYEGSAPDQSLSCIGATLVDDALGLEGHDSIPNLTATFANDYFGPEGVVTTATLPETSESGDTQQPSVDLIVAMNSSSTSSASNTSASSSYSYGFNRRVLQSKSYHELAAVRKTKTHIDHLLTESSSTFVQLDLSAEEGFQVTNNQEVEEKKTPPDAERQMPLPSRTKSAGPGKTFRKSPPHRIKLAATTYTEPLDMADDIQSMAEFIPSSTGDLTEEDDVPPPLPEAQRSTAFGFSMRGLTKMGSRRHLPKTNSKNLGAATETEVKKRFFNFGNASSGSLSMDVDLTKNDLYKHPGATQDTEKRKRFFNFGNASSGSLLMDDDGGSDLFGEE